MRHTALILSSIVWVASLIGVSAPAGAAPLLSVNYDVTGGGWQAGGGPVITITGGSAVLSLSGSPISTPAVCNSGCGYANITFTGVTLLTFNSAPLINLVATPGYLRAVFTFMFAGTYQSTGMFTYKTSKTVGYGTIQGYKTLTPSITFYAYFTIGNEIRVFEGTPTPTPTPATPTATPPTATPTPGPVGGAMFRVRRSQHGHEPPPWTSSFTRPYSEPNPNAPGYYPPATALFTSMGGFTIPRGVIHFGTATYDSYVAQCNGCRPFYPSSIYYYSYYNYKGLFQPSNPNGATTTTTIKRTTTSPFFTTTLFSGRYDFSRRGSIKITPGPNRFGGTMRYFGGLNARSYQFNSYYSPCCEQIYGHNFRTEMGPYGTPTGSLGFTESSAQVVGGTHPGKEFTRVHTSYTTGSGTPSSPGDFITRMEQFIRTTAPWTTGRVSVMGGGYFTTITKTGYDNRNGNGSLGTVSLVVPWLTNSYLTPYNPLDPVDDWGHYAGIQTMKVHFLPEPMGIAMLSAGIFGLAAVYRLRKR